MSHLEEQFIEQVRAAGLPEPISQHAFHPQRKWRFDFAWPEPRIAVEIQGGSWVGGHSRGRAISREYEKHNAATNWGWRVLLFDTVMVEEGIAIDMLKGSLNVPYFAWFGMYASCGHLPKKENAKRKKGI